METLTNLEQRIINSNIEFERSNIEFERSIERLKFNQAQFNLKMQLLKEKLPLFIKALKEQKLELIDLSFRKQGLDNNWSSTDRLSVCFSGKPIDKSFKFIRFDGYTKSGSGKNHDRLQNKAKKISEKFFLSTEINCSVNPYSLEENYGTIAKHPNVVMFELSL